MTTTRKIKYRLEAAVFFTLIGVFRLLGVDGASAVGGFLGRNILYRTPLTNRARTNLKAGYPEKGAEEIEAIIRDMWDNLGRTVAEYPHLDRFSYKGAHPRIEIANMALGVRI